MVQPLQSKETCKIRTLHALLYLLLASTCGCSLALELSPPDGDRMSRPRLREGAGRMAYATLLYGDAFLLGVRVLGQSLRESGTQKDMVAIVTAGVSHKGATLLQADGWIIKRVDLISNPSPGHPSKFWGVYTKLSIFNLTDYDRVLYLDADTIVAKSLEDAFTCSGFCAILRHSERLNSGVMVVEPSADLYSDMMHKIARLPSYTGGDQGFLNSYYTGFVNAPLYDPEKDEPDGGPMHRLPTTFNGDIGLYVLASNKWMVDESALRVIHYTLGPLKPWDWWTAFLLKPVSQWQAIRRRLPASLPGTEAGLSNHTRFMIKVLVATPLLFTIFLARRCLMAAYRDLSAALMRGQLLTMLWGSLFHPRAKPGHGVYTANAAVSAPSNGGGSSQFLGGGGLEGLPRTPQYLEGLSVVVCFGCSLLGVGIAGWVVPRQVPPLVGLFLVYEWTFCVFGLAWVKYLEVLRYWGRASASYALPSPEGLSKRGSPKIRSRTDALSSWDSETTLYLAALATMAIFAPALPSVLGIDALFGKVGAWAGGISIFVSVMTYVAQRLAVRWYMIGRDGLAYSRCCECV